MGKQCAKCQYIQPEGSTGYEPECPKCGANYATGEAAPTKAQPATAEAASNRPAPTPPRVPLSTRGPESAGGGMIALAIIAGASGLAGFLILIAGPALLAGVYLLIFTVAIAGGAIVHAVNRAANSIIRSTLVVHLANMPPE